MDAASHAAAGSRSGARVAQTPAPHSGPLSITPDDRAEAIIDEALAHILAERGEAVIRARSALELAQCDGHRDRDEKLWLRSTVNAAERHLAEAEHRQSAWRHRKEFDRDIIERVLLLARIADLGDANARGWEELRSVGIPGGASSNLSGPVDEQGAAVSNVSALTRYLRARHPPQD